ncbi:hypothetical protein IDJ75_07630 [Mucilaginibacter rigui]|uniref:Uncharacterized protein n=1 Tax=Mucilaginibacter rigui TaxID=534635 RepID=A0ABR7X504_9SPHI|nr:hypothetical protein [Mucilaginibacter rigui]MBD1385145.1 hypothetical protein [Mucilaginibacter rigui]
MKKLFLPLLLILLMGCSMPKMVVINMSEDEFKKEHEGAKVVELSERRTVYYQSFDGLHGGGEKFYYFKNGKLVLMDEGFHPLGAALPVPTPER